MKQDPHSTTSVPRSKVAAAIYLFGTGPLSVGMFSSLANPSVAGLIVGAVACLGGILSLRGAFPSSRLVAWALLLVGCIAMSLTALKLFPETSWDPSPNQALFQMAGFLIFLGMRGGATVFLSVCALYELQPTQSGVSTDAKSGRLSRHSIVATLAVVALLAVEVGFPFFALSRMHSARRSVIYKHLISEVQDTFNYRDAIRGIPTREDDLVILLNAYISPQVNGQDRQAICRRLGFAKSSDSTDIDAEVAKCATMENLNDDMRLGLFAVLKYRCKVWEHRSSPSVLSMLHQFAASSSISDATRKAATNTAEQLVKMEQEVNNKSR